LVLASPNKVIASMVDEVTLGLDGIVLDLRGDYAVVQLRVMDVWIASLDVGGEVFADKAVEQGAEDVLLEVPAIDRAAHIIGNLPDLPLERGALLDACHSSNSLK